MELHKRRKAITEPETRYFMHQVSVLSCVYIGRFLCQVARDSCLRQPAVAGLARTVWLMTLLV